ncbi:MAG: DUF1579 domain-containing protein [Planctomycetota bacterium]
MICRCLFFATLACTAMVPAIAQLGPPQAGPEYDLFKKDVGTWDAEIKSYVTPDFKADPNAEPMVSKGVEKNEMVGPFWLSSSFKSDFAGNPFSGRAMMGFDPKAKVYVGTWIDSMTQHPLKMKGNYDQSTKTLTMQSQGIGTDGKPTTGKAVTVYKDADTRVMTMYEKVDGKFLRSMEITYTRKK